MRSLAGRRAFVTGSTQGLGLATARRLADAGCQVVLHGLEPEPTLAALQRQLAAAAGVPVHTASADLRDRHALERMVAGTLEMLGGIDILVNNAVTRHVAPIDGMAPEAWDEDLAVNLSAAFHTIRLALPGMKERGWGRIVNVSSIYGLVGAVNRVGYVTTKTALIGLTRAVALETVDYDITCNAVCPGTSATPLHEAALKTLMQTGGLTREAAEHRLLTGKQPTGRLISPEGVASLILTLCAPESRDITGAAIPIDGGWSAA